MLAALLCNSGRVQTANSGGYWVDSGTLKERNKNNKTENKIIENIDRMIEEALEYEFKLDQYPSDINKLSNKQRFEMDTLSRQIDDIMKRIKEARLQRDKLNYYMRAAIALLLL